MKRTIALLTAIFLCPCLFGCGRSADYSAAAYTEEAAYDYYTEDYYYDDYDSVGLWSSNGTYDAEEAAPSATLPEQETSGTPSAADSTAVDSSKIIYTCTATVETYDFDQTCAAVDKLIATYGGFLESSSVSGNSYGSSSSRYASYTIRIPRQYFSTVTDGLSELGNVPSRTIEAENITSEYRDTESRLATYRTEEERLLAMLEKAETVEDMLNIEDRLATVRYNIESLTGTLQGWDSLVSYSTLYLSVREVKTYTVTEEPGYWESVKIAFRNSLNAIAGFFTGLLRWFIGALPILVLLAAVVWVLVFLVRRALRRRRAASPKAPKAPVAPAAPAAPGTPTAPIPSEKKDSQA